MVQVAITTDTVELILETRDTETARQILAALPVRARAMKWGEEVYFMVPVNAGREADAKPVVEPGEIGFWTQGHAITIGYGRTPLSTGSEIHLAAPVQYLGRRARRRAFAWMRWKRAMRSN